MPVRRSLPLAALAALLLTLLLAPPALAHTTLKSSTPANGSTLAAAPRTVSLTFGEAVRLAANPIRITGPGGAGLAVGKATVAGATVTAPVTGTGPAGAYALVWRVVADDGDTISGTVRFTLAAPKPAPAPAPKPAPAPVATTAPAATAAAAAAPSGEPVVTATAVPVALPAAEQSGGAPAWLWVIGGVLVAGAAAGLVARSRARR